MQRDDYLEGEEYLSLLEEEPEEESRVSRRERREAEEHRERIRRRRLIGLRRRRRAMIMRVIVGIVLIASVAIIVRAATGLFRSIRHPERPSSGAVQPPEASAGTQGTESGSAGTSSAPAGPVKLLHTDMLAAYGAWDYQTGKAMPDGQIVSDASVIYSYETMRDDLSLLKKRYGDLLEVYCFGTTADDRELLDVVIGSPDAQRDIVIQYAMHGREYVNSLIGMRHVETVLSNWETGSYRGTPAKEYFSKVRFHLIPMMNPDGVTISEFGGDAIRNEELRAYLYQVHQMDIALGKGDPDVNAYWKTWKANAKAVDINRNFDCGWEETVGTIQPSCSRYKGPAAASEAETKALLALTDKLNCVGQIAYHSEGRVIYWDYGSSGELREKDRALVDIIAEHTGYEPHSTVSSSQEMAGCSDYYMLKEGIPSVTVETGFGDCPIGDEQWARIWDENKEIPLAIAWWALNHT